MMKTGIHLLIALLMAFAIPDGMSQSVDGYFNHFKDTRIPSGNVSCDRKCDDSTGESLFTVTCSYEVPELPIIVSGAVDTLSLKFTEYSSNEQFFRPSRGECDELWDRHRSYSTDKSQIKKISRTYTKTFVPVKWRLKSASIRITACESAIDLNEQLQENTGGGTVWEGEGVSEGRLFQVNAAGTYTVTAKRTFIDGPHTLTLTIVTTPKQSDVDVAAGMDIEACFYPEEMPFAETLTKIRVSNTGERPNGGTWSVYKDAQPVQQGTNEVNDTVYVNPALDTGTYDLRYSYTSEEGCIYTDEKEMKVKSYPEGIYENLTLTSEGDRQEIFYGEVYTVNVEPDNNAFILDPNTFTQYGWDLDDGIRLENCQSASRIYTQQGLKTIVFHGTVASGCVHTIAKPDFFNVAGADKDNRLSADELRLLKR